LPKVVPTIRVAGVELGGTKALVTVGAGPIDALAPVRISTSDPAETLDAVVAALERFRAEGPFAAIGVASFGPIELRPERADYGRILSTPKLRWSGADVLGPLRRLGVPLALETDVNAAALGEGRWGAAAGLRDHAYITVGTGVGVGLVSGGAAVHGAGHPEGGHLGVVRAEGDQFPGACPFHGGCVEGMISGPALLARSGRPAEDMPADDPAWAYVADYLAQLCTAIVYLLAPGAIVLGGGVGRRPEILKEARRRLIGNIAGYLPRLQDEASATDLLRPAALENAGLMGALLLASAAAGA
jgi:fructokinase